MTNNEVGGFGITEADDLLFVTDFILVKQKVTAISISFEDDSVADFFDDQVEAGRKPEQFARIWLHTHPGNSPEPSITDENTFTRVFGICDWAIMFIIAQDKSTYVRLRFNAGPGGEIKIPVCIDYNCEFDAADFEIWQQQYLANVIEDKIFKLTSESKQTFGNEDFSNISQCPSQNVLDEIDAMDPVEKEYLLEELAIRNDFWDESEILHE